MTQTDFDHLLAKVDALTPAQARRLLRELEGRVAASAAQPEGVGQTPVTGRRAQPAGAAPARAGRPLTIDEVHQKLLAEGRISRLPDTAADYDDPDDQPVAIPGEPLSETVIRERR